MALRTIGAMCAVSLSFALSAPAQLFTRSTSCADFIRMTQQKPDDPTVAPENHELVGIMMSYVSRGSSSSDLDGIFRKLSAGARGLCAQHPQATVGQTVDQTAQEANLAASYNPQQFLMSKEPPPSVAVAPDEATTSAVALFRQTCLTFDSSASLQSWAIARHMQEIPPGLVPLESLGKLGRASP